MWPDPPIAWQANGTFDEQEQTFIDTYPRVAVCKLYTEKAAITAADLLNDRVIPFFAEHKISLLRILTDRGREYYGEIESHTYRQAVSQLYLAEALTALEAARNSDPSFGV